MSTGKQKYKKNRISTGINFQVGNSCEFLWVRCNFLTTPKVRIRAKIPKTLPDGYPLRPKTLGECIKKKRLDMGLFQKDVARIVGVSTDTVTNWERGRTEPGTKNISKIELFLEK